MDSIAKLVVCLAGTLLLLPRMSAAGLATGPLRVHRQNARHFTDGSTNATGALRVVYLTGSHTWANLIDRGPSDPPPAFDFDGYLDFLVEHHHNFIRLWDRQVSWYDGAKRSLRAPFPGDAGLHLTFVPLEVAPEQRP